MINHFNMLLAQRQFLKNSFHHESNNQTSVSSPVFSLALAFAQPPAGPHNEMDVVEKHCLNVRIPPYSLTDAEFPQI